MIGWLFTIMMFVTGALTKDSNFFIAAGLFAIGGCISFAATTIGVAIKKKGED